METYDVLIVIMSLVLLVMVYYAVTDGPRNRDK